MFEQGSLATISTLLLLLSVVSVDSTPAQDRERRRTSEKTRSSKSRTDDEKPAKIDKNAPWTLPEVGYVEELEEANPFEKVSGEVKVKVWVIPNALDYFIARECEDLVDAGYEDKEVAAKLARAYKKYKAQKNRVLFIVKIGGAETASRVFYVSDPKRHIQLKAKKKGTVGVVEQSEKPSWKTWQIYQYVPGAKRKVGKKKLAAANNQELFISSRAIQSDKSERISLTLSGLLQVKSVKGGKGDEGLGANERFDQISMYRWRDQLMRPLEFRIYPSRWKNPKPPRELRRIIERLQNP